ncbi:ATP synthase F0 subunit B [Candidatus Mycalebacterium sp.]
MKTKAKVLFAGAFFAAFTGAPGAFAADDLITADKTLFVQFIIFLVALYLLNILFFKPLMKLADRREKATSGSGKEAEDLSERTREMSGQYDSAIKEARETALAERALITKEAAAEAENIVFSAREEARGVLEKRVAELAAEAEKAKAEMKSKIEDMAAMVVRAVGRGNNV